MLADLGAGFQFEVAAGYLYEYLDGGPHWVIQPIHEMPEVSPESGTVSLNYSKALGASYTFTARLESSYTGPRYSIISRILTSSRYVPANARLCSGQ